MRRWQQPLRLSERGIIFPAWMNAFRPRRRDAPGAGWKKGCEARLVDRRNFAIRSSTAGCSWARRYWTDPLDVQFRHYRYWSPDAEVFSHGDFDASGQADRDEITDLTPPISLPSARGSGTINTRLPWVCGYLIGHLF
ncbi:hypothetical protein [Sphingopyxis sp.]|uniref:hypothetical protein n=1 Tax=Sphingopyxis sp. TaxID=1908224 RepID=UPI0025DB5D75|nr:hypothetical protein [Sphingopyxis sp.]MBK6412918.1 hypothetical protein [Sphingopyxis sp.]